MVKKIVLVITIAVVAIIMIHGYNNRISTLEYKISRYLDSNYSEDGVQIALSDLTDFEWEKAIVIFPGAPYSEVRNAIGVEYSKSLGFVAGIIFVNKNEIVYKEEFRNFLHMSKASPLVIYTVPKDDSTVTPPVNIRVFTHEDAIFRVQVTHDGNEIYYLLYPLTKE